MSDFKILPWDDSIINNMNSTELDEYESNNSMYGTMGLKCTGDWGMPIVTGHKFKV